MTSALNNLSNLDVVKNLDCYGRKKFLLLVKSLL